MKKIAIVGTAVGQRYLYKKAKELGLYTIGFSWERGCIEEAYIDKYYSISIKEMDNIVRVCQQESVVGVVSNGSDLSVKVSSYVAEKLGLPCTPYEVINKCLDKSVVRELSKDIEHLGIVKNYIYEGKIPRFFPCIVKPTQGGGKRGVSYAYDEVSCKEAIDYLRNSSDKPILIEEYIDGKEVSVETISQRGIHYLVQITDKDSSGAPHFVELGHHQPSELPNEVKCIISQLIPTLLNKVGFVSGAAHTELKIREDGTIYLIEINPRGGGDEISTQLVYLSTGYDYISSMIKVAIGEEIHPRVLKPMCSGIYFLTKQTSHLVDFFKNAHDEPWLVEKKIASYELEECTGNAFKNGHLIYQSTGKIEPIE